MIQIALHRPSNFLGKIITKLSRGVYSHASLVINGEVIEACPFHRLRKLKSLSQNVRRGTQIDLFTVSLTEEQQNKIIEFANRQLNKKYDYWMVFGFVWYATKEGRKSFGKWFCSEFVCACLEKVGYNLFRKEIPAWKISPSHIYWSDKIVFDKTVVI